MNWITEITQRFRRMVNTHYGNVQDVIDRSNDDICNPDFLRNNPMVRSTYIGSSRHEDQCNSQYSGILNTMSNHCIGTIPLPVALADSDILNDSIEDRWYEWGQLNGIGSSLREARRKAAQTGIAILIPYKSMSDYDIKLAYRVLGGEVLQSPRASSILKDPFVNPYSGEYTEGIEYWPTGEVRRVWIKEEHKIDPTPYDVGDLDGKFGAIVWFKQSRPFPMMPECLPAFNIIPSMSRFMQNVLREAELKSAVPMAVKLDWNQYKATSAAPPKGAFKYEPGMIPTLPQEQT
jgi:hypothetical protein